MHSFNETCISRVNDFQPGEIKALRDQLNVRQPLFARYLNTSVSTVQKWESGVKHPGGLALKLLNIVQKHGPEVLT